MNAGAKENFPWMGSCKIHEEEGLATDVKGNELSLHRGKYEMMSHKFDVMIRKGVNINLESYNLLCDFRHDNAIPLLNYYYDDLKNGCLVIPVVSTSFELWFQQEGNKLLFDESGLMTVLFKDMIIGLCNLVDSLIKRKLIIQKFDVEDFYFYLASKKLCVLLTQVKEGTVDSSSNWNYVKQFISWCEKKCDVRNLSESFCQYIGKSHFNVARLKNYPDAWDDATKGQYLMSLVASDHTFLRNLLRSAEVDWPYKSNSRVSNNLPLLMQQIIEWEETENDREYSISDRVSYINLLRNIYKHFDTLPLCIKATLSNRKALIDTIEEWSPKIWINIYERAGWPKPA